MDCLRGVHTVGSRCYPLECFTEKSHDHGVTAMLVIDGPAVDIGNAALPMGSRGNHGDSTTSRRLADRAAEASCGGADGGSGGSIIRCGLCAHERCRTRRANGRETSTTT